MRPSSNTLNVSSSLPDFPPTQRLPLPAALDLLSATAKLLFANGQTTEKMAEGLGLLGAAIGYRVAIFPTWGQVIMRLEAEPVSRYQIIATEPAGVDMSKVSETTGVINQVCEGRTDAEKALVALEAIGRSASVSVGRFALLAGAGAAALGVIFGAAHPLSLILIAFSAGMGACLRRWLAGISSNLFVQPFCASLLAGVIGALVVRLHLDSALRLVAVCPCMVLVPGPHLLSGAMDLARARIPLGIARVVFACLITLTICTGLLFGLALCDVSLPASGPSQSVPLGYDVLAAGVAVAAYGTFFNMPWRMLPIPIAVGMLAHACRWLAISVAGANPAIGALIACLVVGIIMTLVADRLRLPFAGVAFASVVSLIPGVFLFRMAGGMVDVISLGARAPLELFSEVIADGTNAVLIVVAMTFGLVLPRLFIENLKHLSLTRGDKDDIKHSSG